MGVRACFRRLYGPDLVGLPKRDAAYYRAIFADSGVDPATALVVDDSATALRWAAEANAVTVLVEPPAGDPPPQSTRPSAPGTHSHHPPPHRQPLRACLKRGEALRIGGWHAHDTPPT